tara:strand:+ start:2527 stop:3021 length:495 start_codon:yes stop_codon:yes gene_type:complete
MISSSSTLIVSNVSTVGLGTTRPPEFTNNDGQNVGHLASAWITFNNATTNAVHASYNCLGFVDNGVGRFIVNFTNSLETGANISTSSLYAVSGMGQASSNRVSMMIHKSSTSTDHTDCIHTTFVKMRSGGSGATASGDQDGSYNSVIVFANPSQGFIAPQRKDG